MNRIYLYVPFEEISEVKALGALKDEQSKCWYITADMDTAKFKKWLPLDGNEEQTAEDGEEEFLIVSEHAFVACAAESCWKCRSKIEVICIYCESGTISDEPHSEFSVSNVTAIDNALQEQLKRWPTFKKVYSNDNGRSYFANCCQHCHAIQEDYFLHCEPYGAFFKIKSADPGSITFTALSGRVRLNGDEGFEP